MRKPCGKKHEIVYMYEREKEFKQNTGKLTVLK
jgi:hypothetical protein